MMMLLFFFLSITATGQALMSEPFDLLNTSIEHKVRSLLVNFLDCDPNSVVISQLKDGVVNCYNNTDYKITIGNKSYFAKYGNQNGELLGTSLPNEILCRQIASTNGISPKVLLCDSEETIMITEFIEIKEELDLKRPATKKRYINLLHRLHTSNVQFPLKFCPFQIIQHYIENALKAGVSLPKILFEKILPTIYAFNKEAIFLNSAPCHLDPQFANVLDDGTNMYLIDWECAGMCDPLFDLASMCAVEEFSDEEMLEILTLYLKSPPSVKDLDRFYQMRILADMRFCAYCYLQTKISSTRTDLYRSFAEGFLTRITERIQKLQML